MQNRNNAASNVTRRDFIKASATISALAATGSYAHAQGQDRIRVGVIGCGGRGSGAAVNCMDAHPSVEIYAIGDLFPERITGLRDRLSRMGAAPKPRKDGDKTIQPTQEDIARAARRKRQTNLAEDRMFSGFDAYQKVIGSGVDLVILATPPGFRPEHLRAAVAAGKHVFMEKPVAVDPAGVRSIIASSDIAAQKKLGIVAGTQRRHQNDYLATMQKIHEGAIGDIVAAQCYWNQGGLWMHPRQAAWSDMEWQIKNWLYFTWLSGDHIVEQHVHNIDVVNWAMRAHPVKALGSGGRQSRTSPEYGHVYDHFTIEYEYPNGARVLSMCRQIDGTASRVGENLVGTKGRSNAHSSIRGETNWRYEGPGNDPYTQEHIDLINSIRAGTPLNEGRQIAESTLTAIMGRLSAYSGQEVSWDQALNSSLDLMPVPSDKLAFGPLPVPPVAVPGRLPVAEVIPPPKPVQQAGAR